MTPTTLLAALLLLGRATPAQETGAADVRLHPPELLALDELVRTTGIPGATLATAFERPPAITGTTSGSVGLADVEAGRRMPAHARMLSGSTGKTFVAATALALVERGALELDDTLQEWLGDLDWVARLPNGKLPITLRQLLDHTSGIPEYYLQPDFLPHVAGEPRRAWTVEELLGFLEGVPPHFAPGEGWSYADSNYLLAGLVIERAGGAPFYEQVERLFLGPLELDRTSPADGPRLAGLVPGYTSTPNLFGLPRKLWADGEHVLDPSFEWCGGGFVTTPYDLARWMLALHSGKVLGAESMEAMLRTHPADAGGPHRYGLGVQVFDTRLGELRGHTGFFPGYLTAIGYFPDHGLAIALQVNTDDARLLGKPLVDVLVDLADVALGRWEPREPEGAGER